MAALTTVIEIDGIPVKFACSAATPRKYRNLTGGDLFGALQKLDKSNLNLEVVENLAYTMAKDADPDLQIPIDEWLGQFGPMSIIGIAPKLVEFWTGNMESGSKSKKK